MSIINNEPYKLNKEAWHNFINQLNHPVIAISDEELKIMKSIKITPTDNGYIAESLYFDFSFLEEDNQ